MCDLSDNCGDMSDEDGEYCEREQYSQNTSEDENNPLGMFSPGPGDPQFLWKRGSGETANRGTGPPFDHTTFDAEGHYLYIDSSEQQPEHTFAELVSVPFHPNVPGPECRMIFYFHMLGNNVGDLTVSVR